MDKTKSGQQRREQHVDTFLNEIGLQRSALSVPTRQHLNEWARQALLVMDQPSSNWDSAILNLCRAVESEMADRLGSVSVLQFFANQISLGEKARSLAQARLDKSGKQQLEKRGIKPGFVTHSLSVKLHNLANIRAATAHGGTQVQSATEKDAQKTRGLVSDVFRGIVPSPEAA
jgi:hypothetical protein